MCAFGLRVLLDICMEFSDVVISVELWIYCIERAFVLPPPPGIPAFFLAINPRNTWFLICRISNRTVFGFGRASTLIPVRYPIQSSALLLVFELIY